MTLVDREIRLPHQEARFAAEHEAMEAELCALLTQGEREVQTTVLKFRHMVTGTLEGEDGEQHSYDWLRLQPHGEQSRGTIDLRPLHALPPAVLTHSGRFFVAQRTGLHTESNDMQYVQRNTDGWLVLHTLVPRAAEEPEAPEAPAGDAPFEAWTAYDDRLHAGVGGVAMRKLHYEQPLPNAYHHDQPRTFVPQVDVFVD